MDRNKRRVAQQMLGILIDYRSQHYLWRLANTWSEGLTPKEQAYIDDCMGKIDEQYKRLAALQARLNRTT